MSLDVDKTKCRWWAWHKKNPQVWVLFQKFTFEAIRSGRTNYSHWAVVSRIRWETDIITKGNAFKISNDFIGYYARYFIHSYPEHKDFFVIKPLKHERGNKDGDKNVISKVERIEELFG